ncbi:trifunctional hydroxymethylpyrimidine kinase/phosphomethylpyrimidine kinase/thiaminase [Vanrija albida]|uniref:Trifunctional hydroxymethylpyrimidine kinase/phosphomethylpyrimidine kinase/thiaminase n=1 Tax=Vanrija albida TaxID=181172 RepID=A0ABR3QFR7_9TREE
MSDAGTLSLAPVSQPHVLTIAGSDSGGGAGIQADIKTIAALGGYGSSVITALTAQNTLGVQDVHHVPADFVIKQLESIFADDLRPDAIKFGMLAQADTISALAKFFAAQGDAKPFLVLDPVMISTSGHTLLPESATRALVDELLPLVSLATPNIPEAVVIASAKGEALQQPKTLDDLVALAAALRERTGVPSVLLKGGHLSLPRKDVTTTARERGLTVTWDASGEINEDDGVDVEVISDWLASEGLAAGSPDVIVDILVDASGTRLFVGTKVESTSTHGTGCTLSAALATAYALDSRRTGTAAVTISAEAVGKAIEYTQGAIATAFPLGRGHGPLNHSYLQSLRTIPQPSAHNPIPFLSYLIRSCPDMWRQYVRHPFVDQIGKGTLPLPAFKHYIVQDYHYLRHYARAHGLGAYKSTDMESIKAFAEISLHIAAESTMHVAMCEKFGVTPEELHSTPEAAASSAYSRFILDIGTQGDVLDLYVAVASCLIGYGEVGLWLQRRLQTGQATLEGNPYARWIGDYSGGEYIGAVRRGISNLERRIAADPPTPARLARLTGIWQEVVRLERDFWQMGLDQSF